MYITSADALRIENPWANPSGIHTCFLFSEDKILSFVSQDSKKMIIEKLHEKQIKIVLGKPFDKNNTDGITYDNVLFCAGSSPNRLTSNFKINEKLQLKGSSNIYLGGDCINSKYIKTAQVAYQQGVYVAKRLNGEIKETEEFEYKSNGIALNIGDNKVLVEGHSFVKDGVYPNLIIKLYSLFFV